MSDIQNTMQDVNSSGFASGVALAALTASKGSSYSGYSPVAACTTLVDGFLANGVADIRRDIQESTCDIRHDVMSAEASILAGIKESECSVTAAVKDSESRLQRDLNAITITMLNNFAEVGKQAVKAEYEAKLTAEKVIKELSAVAQHNAERSQDKTEAFALRTQDKLDHGFEENEEKMDALSSQISKGFFHAREEDLEEKADFLSQELQTAKLLKAICCGCSDPKGK